MAPGSGGSRPSGGKLSRAELLAQIAAMEPWFHCIDLGDGILTKSRSEANEPVDHPLRTWQTLRRCLPGDLTGKRVLDVGCNAGFFSVEAKRRGAAAVLGIDAQRHHIRQAIFVRRALGLDIDYRRMSVYALDPLQTGRFHVTLALGLIYHLKHLVQALEKLWSVTDELMILETAIYPSLHQPQPFEDPTYGAGHPIHAFGYVENPPEAKESVYNWFLPTQSGLLALLRNLGVNRPEVFAVENERAVIVCPKTPGMADSRKLGEHHAGLALERGPARCSPGDALTYALRIRNEGTTRWLAAGDGAAQRGAVRLGCHLLRENDEEVVWDYGRAALTRDLAPGESTVLELRLQAPLPPGNYWIEFDMLAEHISWFEDFSPDALLRQSLTVAAVG